MSHYINRLKALWFPERYHGWGKKEGYFEGWYFKLVDPNEQYAFAVIPGISLGIDGRHHAFIQVLDGKKCTATYYDFPVEAFQPNPDAFELQLGDNFFSTHKLRLNLAQLKGEITMPLTTPWPKSLGAPGIMGWFSFMPFMECYHGVVSVYHDLQGQLEVDGQPIDFTYGKGYTEKDWGVSFPSAWIWTQTNHFDADKPISLMASVAHIPWLGSYFIGYIVGLLWEGKIYRFATYTGAKMKAELGDQSVLLSFKDRRYRLEIVAHKAGGGDLVAPISGNMTGKVNESMQSTLTVRFFENDQLRFEGIGRNAGLEIAGQVEHLLTKNWRR
ncbi:MAG TPA: tocopherol cyclase family protein [Saprospiraceae bacterium]|nr:tocopherol cyclase family protein [Saprospiraceae bacterium]HMQ83484.1 tocopherol cyclase family protein [Saprospiraceae bacterium]